jgi:hypothetical protein
MINPSATGLTQGSGYGNFNMSTSAVLSFWKRLSFGWRDRVLHQAALGEIGNLHYLYWDDYYQSWIFLDMDIPRYLMIFGSLFARTPLMNQDFVCFLRCSFWWFPMSLWFHPHPGLVYQPRDILCGGRVFGLIFHFHVKDHPTTSRLVCNWGQ